ncbi:tellurite resistance/C4-dicarboxylate transporter family protein [Streptomyces achromogenes]|uniref:tellurite resistance/C4-dicarboxylate transporter family protein n=1 Tax=Streptomyces achromogenes TaxID=67255 RepID=UPI0033E452B9
MGARLSERCRELPPACFAPVMATGIVSRALGQAGAHAVSGVLFGLAAALYVPLLAAAGVKAAVHRGTVRAELRDPGRLFGHYTLVAASGVLAGGAAGGPDRIAGWALLAVAVVVWAGLARATVRLRRAEPDAVLRRADGIWFLATVGLQAIVLTLTSLAPTRPGLAVALVLWGAGLPLYAGTLALVLRRLRHHPPRPAQALPSYWVTMGAAAISTLAGGRLLGHEELLPGPARGLVGGTVVALWVWATVLIPPLVTAGVWRHLRHRVPFAYEPTLWCVVFPLGMYATATAQLAGEHRIDTGAVPHGLLAWLALSVWLAVGARCLTGRAAGGARRGAAGGAAGGAAV